MLSPSTSYPKNKQRSHFGKIGLFASAAVCLALFSFLLGENYTYAEPVPTAPVSRLVKASVVISSPTSSFVESAVKKGIGVPVLLKIPTIGVSAAIERVGLTKAGSMGTPKKPMNAGWYSLGSTPGHPGSAVIAGHVDWWGGQTGVFANLHKLKVGDEITVQDDSGKTSKFVVRTSKSYEAQADATDVFIAADGASHLNLITCYGVWDKKAGQYSQRLVVFADRVDE